MSLVACGAKVPPAAAPPPRVGDPAAQVEELGHLVERYWAESAALTPWYAWGGIDMRFAEPPAENIAPQTLADSLAIERRYLAASAKVPRPSLDAQSRLTYDMFRRERSLIIEGFTYPFELMPVNPYDGMLFEFAVMAPGAERLAMSSAAEYDNWRARVLSFVRWTKQAVANMREGVRRGYTVPRILVEKALPQLAALGADTPANAFYQPLSSGSGGNGDAQRSTSAAAVAAVVSKEILPSYRALHDFLLQEYLPRTRTSVGWSALPLGDAWYAYLVRRTAGDTANPAELHALGIAEVERLHHRIQSLLSEVSFPGDAQAFYDRARDDPRFSYKDSADLLAAYQELKNRIAEAAPALFAVFPRAEFEIRPVDRYRAAVSPALSYLPRAPNGIRAAALYVNTAGGGEPPALFMSSKYLREAVPGHHYQIELQRERTDLPRFRRFGGAPAFVDGWGLYAVTLGDELNAYREPEAKFGALLAQLNCAAGLVLDTGLHAMGWTRQQALDYLHAQVPADGADAAEAIDRDIALPAKALACTVGFLKFQSLRAAAQQARGGDFDAAAYHAALIRDGAMPMDLVEGKMKSWLALPATTRTDPSGGGAAASGGAAGVAAASKLD